MNRSTRLRLNQRQPSLFQACVLWGELPENLQQQVLEILTTLCIESIREPSVNQPSKEPNHDYEPLDHSSPTPGA